LVFVGPINCRRETWTSFHRLFWTGAYHDDPPSLDKRLIAIIMGGRDKKSVSLPI
jgi:hypothetical protein